MAWILRLIDTVLSRIESGVIAVLSLTALAIGTAQVVLRYGFNTGVHWSEAIFILLTVAAMLFAGSRAARDDEHVRVDLLPRALGARGKTALRLLRYLLALGLCGFYLYGGVRYVLFTHSMGVTSPDSGLPVWIIYLIVPVTMAFFCVRYALLLLREARGEVTGKDDAEEAATAVRYGQGE